MSGLCVPGIRTTNRVKSAPSRSQTFKLLDSKLRSPAKAKVCPHKRQVGRGKARQARGPRPFDPPLKTGFHYSSHSHVYSVKDEGRTFAFAVGGVIVLLDGLAARSSGSHQYSMEPAGTPTGSRLGSGRRWLGPHHRSRPRPTRPWGLPPLDRPRPIASNPSGSHADISQPGAPCSLSDAASSFCAANPDFAMLCPSVCSRGIGEMIRGYKGFRLGSHRKRNHQVRFGRL